MLIELFEVGSGWWVLLWGIASVLIIGAVKAESPKGAAIALAMAAGVSMALSDPWAYIKAAFSVRLVLGFLGGYVALGVAWGAVAWLWYVRDRIKRFEDLKQQWLALHDDLGEKWLRWLWYEAPDFRDARQDSGIRVVPSVWVKRSLVLGWMAFWPWSFAWRIVCWLLGELWERVFHRLAGWLQELTERWFPEPE